MAAKRAEIKITGFVQGVFFRQGIASEAERLGLVGWVRNEPDGSVKIVAEGKEEKLQKLVEWCKKGTKQAKVDEIEAEWKEATGESKNFEIL